MHFAEVQVFSSVDGTNVALNKSVTGSSLYSASFPPSNLVDGNLTNMAHSSGGDAAWFLIDLGSMLPIGKIRLLNRTDCCQARENGVVVTILDMNKVTIFTSNPIADQNGSIVYADARSQDSLAFAGYDLTPPKPDIVPQERVTPPHIVARYVKLFQPTVGYMHFAEVQVYSTIGGTNIALGVSATGSSLYSGSFPPSNLVDGNLTNFAHTSGSDAPWYLIDLGSMVPIVNVHLINRTDCCQARQNGVVLSLLDASKVTVFTANPLSDQNGMSTYADDRIKDRSAYASFDINPPNAVVTPGQGQSPSQNASTTARYVKVTQPISGYLNLAEIQVFSTAGGANIAAGKSVTASSTYDATNNPLSNFTNAILSDWTATTGRGGEAGWIMIDLGSVVPIFLIRVFNRADCCQARANGIVVSTLDSSTNTVFTATPFNDQNGVTVYTDDRGKDAAAYQVYNISPPSATVNGMHI